MSEIVARASSRRVQVGLITAARAVQTLALPELD